MESFFKSCNDNLDKLKRDLELLPTLLSNSNATEASITEIEINGYRKELIEVMQNSLFWR